LVIFKLNVQGQSVSGEWHGFLRCLLDDCNCLFRIV
jgi:hypothetical protein